MHKLDLKVPPVAQVLIVTLFIYVSSLTFPLLPMSITLKTSILVISASIAMFIAISGILAFKHAQTTVNPMSPESASSLVTHGIYKYTRNPMYLGLVILLSGEALFLASPVSLFFVIGFIAYMNQFQIIPEERALNQLFGNKFIEYKQQTRRWI